MSDTKVSTDADAAREYRKSVAPSAHDYLQGVIEMSYLAGLAAGRAAAAKDAGPILDEFRNFLDERIEDGKVIGSAGVRIRDRIEWLAAIYKGTP